MGQARARGTYQERVKKAIEHGALKIRKPTRFRKIIGIRDGKPVYEYTCPPTK